MKALLYVHWKQKVVFGAGTAGQLTVALQIKSVWQLVALQILGNHKPLTTETALEELVGMLALI